MAEADEFIDTFLTHARADYDPVKAREYYLRTRELKGRKPAQRQMADDRSYTPPTPKSKSKSTREQIDDFVKSVDPPFNSPKGASLLYIGGSPIKAYYKDGSTYTAKGWGKPDLKMVAAVKKALYKELDEMQKHLDGMKKKYAGKTDKKSRDSLQRLSGSQKQLDRTKKIVAKEFP